MKVRKVCPVPSLLTRESLPTHDDLVLPPRYVELLQSSWRLVARKRGAKDDLKGLDEADDPRSRLCVFADTFYDVLFELDPGVKVLFESAPFQILGSAVMGVVGVVVEGAGDLPRLIPTVQQLGQRHVVYGVKAEHYTHLPNAVVEAFYRVLGRDIFTAEMKEAWLTALSALCDVMKEAAARVEEGVADKVKSKRKFIWRNVYQGQWVVIGATKIEVYKSTKSRTPKRAIEFSNVLEVVERAKSGGNGFNLVLEVVDGEDFESELERLRMAWL